MATDDPNQEQGPSSGNPPQDTPQPTQESYGSSENPYGESQIPYRPPAQNPYATPPYADTSYQGGPGYAPPQSAPLPLVHPMETEPESSQRNHHAYVPTQIQCPRCGAYTPKQNISYRNPQTGEQKNDKGLPACLIMIVGYLATIIVLVVVELGIAGLLYIMGVTLNPMYNDVGFIGIPITFAGAVAAIPVYREWRRNRLSKTHITVRRFVCWHCKNEWTVTQEPPAKKLS